MYLHLYNVAFAAASDFLCAHSSRSELHPGTYVNHSHEHKFDRYNAFIFVFI